MTTKSFATTAGAMALAFAMWNPLGLLQGQAMYDRINVNLPYTVMVGDKTLQPGDYTIQRLPGNGGSPVLLVYSDSGMKFETSALPIAALDVNTARDTKVVLNHVGDDYYVHKIWVQGKDYGYELPVPNSMKSRQNEKMTETTLAARNQPTVETAQVSSDTKAETAQETTPANIAATTSTDKPSETEIGKPAEKAIETQPQTAKLAEQPVTEPVTEPATPAIADNSANRVAANSDRAVDNSADRAVTDDQAPASTPAPAEMPKTAAGWLTMLLSGGALSGASLMLRRKR